MKPKKMPGSPQEWVILDLLPQMVSLSPGDSGTKEEAGLAGDTTIILPGKDPYSGLVDIDRLHAELKEYKVAKNYRNVFISRESLQGILGDRCELRMLKEEARDPERMHRAASRVLKTYMDNFVRLCERQTESAHAEPGLLVKERQVTYEYHITVHAEGAGEKFVKDIEKLLQVFSKQGKELLKDAGDPLSRFYWDRHLFNPMLVEGGKEWKEHVSISPPPLVPSERKLAEDLRSFWKENSVKPEYRDIEVCLLRNLPKVGVGVFSRSGFYPDFILWMRNKKTKSVRVVFLDPHGLHHDGVADNDRFAAIQKLRGLVENKRFKTKKIILDGYILAPSDTTLDKTPGAKDKKWDDLEREYPLLRQGGSYVGRLFSALP